MPRRGLVKNGSIDRAAVLLKLYTVKKFGALLCCRKQEFKPSIIYEIKSNMLRFLISCLFKDG